MEKGVKVDDLTAKVVQWEVEPGRKVEAWFIEARAAAVEASFMTGV